MAGVLLLVAGLGGRGLTFDSVWYDEWRTLVYIGSETPNAPVDIPGTLGRVATLSDALNPPAYYLLLATWGTLTGTDPATLRYLSLLLGLLTVAVVYRVGADLHAPVVGLVAAAVLGTAPMFGVYLHEMRAYPLALLAVAAHLWTYTRVSRPGAGCGDALAFVAVLVVALHTHYTALLMLGGTFGYHLLVVRERRWVAGLYLLAAALMLPWFSVVLTSTGIENVQDRANDALAYPVLVHTVAQMTANEIAWLAALPLLLAVGRGRLLWVHTLAGLAVLLTLNALVPFLCCRRYLLTLLPGLALLVALGLTRWRTLAALAVPLWMAAGVVNGWPLAFAHSSTNSPRWHFPWADVQAALDAEDVPGATVLALLPGGVADWMHTGPAGYYLPGANVQIITTWRHDSESAVRDRVATATAGTDRVWVAYKPSWVAHHHPAALAQLAGTLPACGVVRTGWDAEVWLYAATCATTSQGTAGVPR